MKLSFAAAALLGPLTTTVPTLSEQYGLVNEHDRAFRLDTKILKATAPQSFLDTYHGRSGLRYKRRLMHQATNRNLKNSPIGLKAMRVPCDPRSTDADIGILSCGKDHNCEPSITSSLGGFCTASQVSSHDQVNVMVECDPALVDIGVLACEAGQFCQHDETSELGGLCVDTATYNDRRLQVIYDLQDVLDRFDNCGPWPVEDPVGWCDCSDLNMTTGTGTMVCSHNVTSLWIQGCDEYLVYDVFAFTFKDSLMIELRDCYETKTPFEEKICFIDYLSNTSGKICYAEWNGQRCNSCLYTPQYYFHEFDCTNVDGGVAGDSAIDFFSFFDLCANTTCTNLCGEGSSIPDFNFDFIIADFYNLTCGWLAFYGENALLRDPDCPYYVEAAESYCCEPISTIPKGNSSLPAPQPGDESTIPVETDGGEDDASSAPGTAEANKDDSSAGHIITNTVSTACQAAVVMTLIAGV